MFPRSFFLQLVEKDFSEFEAFLNQSTDEDVAQLLEELHPADIADIVENVGEESTTRIMRMLDDERAAEVLALVEQHHQSDVVEAIPEEKLPKIIDKMDSDDATDILDELSKEDAEEILEAMSREDSAPVRQLMSYAEDSAGGLMQTELVAVTPDSSLAEAIEQVRAQAHKVSDIRSIYVVDRQGLLQGVLPVESLILESPKKKVAEVMTTDYFYAAVELDQEHVAEMFRKYDLIALPVVDQQNKLLGRIMVDDVIDVIQEEAREDIYRMAGVAIEEHATDSPFRSIRLRLPWLLFNLLTAIMAASVVGFFQATIEKVVLLAVFMPIVAGMGGNAGTQSLTVITRAIALGEINFSNARRIFFKEIFAGLFNGICIGLVAAGISYFWNGPKMIGVVLGMAMVCNMFVAALAGTAIPLFLRRIKVDPALASGVIVTTFTDMAGFFAFLGLATLLLRYLV